jgi:putative transposase
MNPVRAKIVNHPAEYRWSSYCVSAQSERSHIVPPHAQYLALGGRGGQPADAYRELFKNDLESESVDQIRDATNGNNVIGGLRFAVDVEAMLGRRVQRGSPGRPKKSTI